jgi:hypothetical protein
MPPPSDAQPVIVCNPERIGFPPDPYELTIIGFAIVPEEHKANVPGKVSPTLKSIESHGKKLEQNEFAFAIVFQGVAEFCACAEVLASSPVVVEK